MSFSRPLLPCTLSRWICCVFYTMLCAVPSDHFCCNHCPCELNWAEFIFTKPLYCFLSRFHLGSGLCFTNPNNPKFTTTNLDIFRLMLHCHGPDQKQWRTTQVQLQSPAGECINRKFELLRALHYFRTEIRHHVPKRFPDEDLVLGHSEYFCILKRKVWIFWVLYLVRAKWLSVVVLWQRSKSLKLIS